jgi:hypothetical protein
MRRIGLHFQSTFFSFHIYFIRSYMPVKYFVKIIFATVDSLHSLTKGIPYSRISQRLYIEFLPAAGRFCTKVINLLEMFKLVICDKLLWQK